MAWWEDLVAEQPEFAERVKARFAAGRHSTLATLRRDGSPRISGTEVSFADEGLWLGSMSGARKALDLRRDPRMALHSLSVDPPDGDPGSWPGDAKIAGRAHEAAVDPTRVDEPHRFRVELTEVVLTRVGEPADHLVIEAWHPGRGLERHVRY
jgi:hypothetical protein